jgi:hypothetical protein
VRAAWDHVKPGANIANWDERLGVLQCHRQALSPVSVNTQVIAAHVALLIGIDDQNPTVGTGQHPGEGRHDRTLPDSALLIGDEHGPR